MITADLDHLPLSACIHHLKVRSSSSLHLRWNSPESKGLFPSDANSVPHLRDVNGGPSHVHRHSSPTASPSKTDEHDSLRRAALFLSARVA